MAARGGGGSCRNRSRLILHRQFRRCYTKFLHGARERIDLLLLLLGRFFLDDGDDGFDGEHLGWCLRWLRHRFRFDASGRGSSCAAAARSGVDERFRVGREGRFGDGFLRDGPVAFRVDQRGWRNGFVQDRRTGKELLRLGLVLWLLVLRLLWGRMVVVVMMLLLLRRRLLVLGWKRFNRMVLRMGLVRGLLFLVLVGFDLDGGSVGDGRDDGGAADGHFRGGGMVRKVWRRRDVFHRAVVADFVRRLRRRRLLLGVELLRGSAAVIVRDHLHLGRVADVGMADVRRRVV